MIKIQHLFKGAPSALINEPMIITSIHRKEVESLIVHPHCIEGDEVHNKKHHGGPQRVIHHYPWEHYQHWSRLYPQSGFMPGLMGENLSTTGILEKNVCIGDIFQIGELVLEVTEPRKPCATINHQFQIKGLAREVQNTSRTGWFYKIITPGTLRSSDRITLIARPYPLLTVDVCVQTLLIAPNKTILGMMANNPALSDNWRGPAREFLASETLPDDRARLGEI